MLQRPSPIWRWGPDSSRRFLRGEALPCAGETAACLSHRWRNELWNWRVTSTWDLKHWTGVILAQNSLSLFFFRFLSQWQLWAQLTYWLVQQWERNLVPIYDPNPGTNQIVLFFKRDYKTRWQNIQVKSNLILANYICTLQFFDVFHTSHIYWYEYILFQKSIVCLSCIGKCTSVPAVFCTLKYTSLYCSKLW